MKALALEDKYDYLVIESTGISEPLPVAQTFVMDASDDHGHGHGHDEFEPLSKYAKMDTLVTVIDAYNFASILGNVESEKDRVKYFGSDEVDGEGVSEESIVQLLIDQIEFANVILLNKIDLLPQDEKSSIDRIKSVLNKLNPKATVIVPEKPKFENFDASKIISTKLFDMEEAQESAGWIAELAKPSHTPETEEYGVSSFVFRNSDRPFHPERLFPILQNFGESLVKNISGKCDKSDIFSSVIRCKGEIWLSQADACPIEVHGVGRQLVLEPAGNPWYKKIMEEYPNGDKENENANEVDCEMWDSVELTSQTIAAFKEAGKWNNKFGDRRSLLVIIGIKLNESKIREALNDALLTDEELNVKESDRRKVWADNLKDPFFDSPLWDLKDIMTEDENEEMVEEGDENDPRNSRDE